VFEDIEVTVDMLKPGGKTGRVKGVIGRPIWPVSMILGARYFLLDGVEEIQDTLEKFCLRHTLLCEYDRC